MFKPIHKKTKVITILGLISCGYLILAFLYILEEQKKYLKENYNSGNKDWYCYSIIIFLILILPTLIFRCLNISYIKEAKSIDPKGNYKTFQRINNTFVIIGFILFAILIVYIIFVPIKKKILSVVKKKIKKI